MKSAIFSDLLVVSLEQAVAAPVCTSRLVEAGARVIKIERPGRGDLARHYDYAIHGESAHFVWLNQGKESAALDIKLPADLALLHAVLRRADIFVQNFSPGAAVRAGLGGEQLRVLNPRLITCGISGYGETGEYASMRAYDNLLQAETGIIAMTGSAEQSAKCGVSIADIGAGLYAYSSILEALFERQQTGLGRDLHVSMFDCMADWMTVHYLFERYGGGAPKRAGLHHATIAPYGPYAVADGREVVIAIQNHGEWERFCQRVTEKAWMVTDPRFVSVEVRVANRPALNAEIDGVFRTLSAEEIIARLRSADIAYARLRSVAEFAEHPALALVTVDTPTGPVTLPRRAAARTAYLATPAERSIPRLGAHTEALRQEFGG